MATPRLMRFVWWNVQDFAHYDPDYRADTRWPSSPEVYAEKCRRVDAVLEAVTPGGPPDLIGLCETTPTAAEELRARLFPEHLIAHPTATDSHRFQVSVCYHPAVGFRQPLPLFAGRLPPTARPMLVIELPAGGHEIQFTFCHWTAFGAMAESDRGRLSDALTASVYAFVCPDGERHPKRHAMVIGDLNAEPFDPVFQRALNASRDRASARRRMSASAHARRWVRLYDAAWRWAGEHHPHRPGERGPHAAGTYCWQDRTDWGWRTYDHVLVTGGLLSDQPPFLNESALRIMPVPEMYLGRDRPSGFDPPTGSGVSDHLPIAGEIALPAEEVDVRAKLGGGHPRGANEHPRRRRSPDHGPP